MTKVHAMFLPDHLIDGVRDGTITQSLRPLGPSGEAPALGDWFGAYSTSLAIKNPRDSLLTTGVITRLRAIEIRWGDMGTKINGEEITLAELNFLAYNEGYGFASARKMVDYLKGAYSKNDPRDPLHRAFIGFIINWSYEGKGEKKNVSKISAAN